MDMNDELTDMQKGSLSESIDKEIGDRLEEMICDLGKESFQQAHASMYDTLQSDSKKSLTLLSTMLSLVNVKAKYGWSDKTFTSLLKVMQGILPKENMLPKVTMRRRRYCV